MKPQDVSSANHATAGLSASAAASKPALCPGGAPAGAIILLLLLDGAVRLVPWSLVTATMDRMGYGSSDCVGRCLAAISLMCAFPPTSFVGAILTVGYLCSAMVSHVEISGSMLVPLLSALHLGVALCGGLWLRDRGAFTLMPFAS